MGFEPDQEWKGLRVPKNLCVYVLCERRSSSAQGRERAEVVSLVSSRAVYRWNDDVV